MSNQSRWLPLTWVSPPWQNQQKELCTYRYFLWQCSFDLSQNMVDTVHFCEVTSLTSVLISLLTPFLQHQPKSCLLWATFCLVKAVKEALWVATKCIWHQINTAHVRWTWRVWNSHARFSQVTGHIASPFTHTGKEYDSVSVRKLLNCWQMLELLTVLTLSMLSENRFTRPDSVGTTRKQWTNSPKSVASEILAVFCSHVQN